MPPPLLRGDREHVAILAGNWVKDGMVIDLAIPIPNEHSDPHQHFSVDVGWWRFGLKCAHRTQRLVLGVLHTHLPHHDQKPSPGDLKGIPDGLVGAVYLPHSDKLFVYGRI